MAGNLGRIMSSRKDKDGMYAVEDILQILDYRLSGNANAANCGYPATSQSFTLDPGSTDWGKNGEREKTRENLGRSFGPRCRSKCWDAQVSPDRPALTVLALASYSGVSTASLRHTDGVASDSDHASSACSPTHPALVSAM